MQCLCPLIAIHNQRGVQCIKGSVLRRKLQLEHICSRNLYYAGASTSHYWSSVWLCSRILCHIFAFIDFKLPYFVSMFLPSDRWIIFQNQLSSCAASSDWILGAEKSEWDHSKASWEEYSIFSENSAETGDGSAIVVRHKGPELPFRG